MARRYLAVLCAALASLVACNQLMGIEEAQVDPLLQGEATTGAGGSNSLGNDGSSLDGPSASANNSSGGGGSATSSGTTGSGPAGEAGASGTDDAVPVTGTASVSGTASGGSGSSGATSTTGGTGPQTLCDSYCDNVTEYCTDDNQQYRDRDQCMAICAKLPEGSLGDTNVNSVACRAKFAGDARYGSGTELAAYCRQAGASGGNRCGSSCEGFCSIMMQVCTPESSPVYHFADSDECLAACELLPELETGYSASNPEVADGNHVQCRLFHVMSAAMLDPEEHCEHAMGITLCEVPESE